MLDRQLTKNSSTMIEQVRSHAQSPSRRVAVAVTRRCIYASTKEPEVLRRELAQVWKHSRQ